MAALRDILVADLPQMLPCKVCGGASVSIGSVDFNRSCNATAPFVPSGISIPYHRCSVCRLLFTAAFDRFAPIDFLQHIYNDDYARFDPEYLEDRPTKTAAMLEQLLADARNARILDYGGGNGRLAQLLRDAGFRDVTTYDPFVAAHSRRPSGSFDVVVSIEVAEHTHTPRQTFAEMTSFAHPQNGIILFSTLLQPDFFERLGTEWPYIAPRNGHLTMYSRDALTRLALDLRFNLASTGDTIHLMFRQLPGFTKSWLGTP